jgi:hypothetical protein
MRQRTLDGLAAFDRAIFRFDNPHAYPAGLSEELFRHREEMRSHEFEIIKQRLSAKNNDNSSG